MKSLQFLICACYLFSTPSCLNVIMACSGIARSHFLLYSRFASALLEHGNNVTRLEPLYNERMRKLFELYPKETKEIIVPIPPSPVYGDADVTSLMTAVAFNYSFSALTSRQELLMDAMDRAANEFAKVEVVEKVVGFDVMVNMPFVFSGTGLATRAGVRVLPVTPANLMPEVSSVALGIPISESIVPSFGASGSDRMTFRERLQNYAFVHAAYDLPRFMPNLNRLEWKYFAQAPDKDFPAKDDLLAEMPFLGLNGAMLLDFPRPITHGVHYLENLDVEAKVSSLPGEMLPIFERKVIVFSLGSVASAKTMPDDFKKTIFDALKQLTEFNILWKFDGEVTGVQEHKHIFLMNWIPQKAVLENPSTVLFITHGGYNSLLEASSAGVPLLLIPLFIDQMANAKRVERLGYGEDLVDFRTTSPNQIVEMARRIANDHRYKDRAVKVGSMLRDTIVNPRKLVADKIAYFHDHYYTFPKVRGRLMSRFVYYCYDVVLFLSGTIGLSLTGFVVALVTFYRKIAKNL